VTIHHLLLQRSSSVVQVRVTESCFPIQFNARATPSGHPTLCLAMCSGFVEASQTSPPPYLHDCSLYTVLPMHIGCM
jgi:hypothetical protein